MSPLRHFLVMSKKAFMQWLTKEVIAGRVSNAAAAVLIRSIR